MPRSYDSKIKRNLQREVSRTDAQAAWSKNLQEQLKSIIAACEAALEHVADLEDAWQRGAIRDIDGQGGCRSNRNVEVRVKLEKALGRND